MTRINNSTTFTQIIQDFIAKNPITGSDRINQGAKKFVEKKKEFSLNHYHTSTPNWSSMPIRERMKLGFLLPHFYAFDLLSTCRHTWWDEATNPANIEKLKNIPQLQMEEKPFEPTMASLKDILDHSPLGENETFRMLLAYILYGFGHAKAELVVRQIPDTLLKNFYENFSLDLFGLKVFDHLRYYAVQHDLISSAKPNDSSPLEADLALTSAMYSGVNLWYKGHTSWDSPFPKIKDKTLPETPLLLAFSNYSLNLGDSERLNKEMSRCTTEELITLVNLYLYAPHLVFCTKEILQNVVNSTK